MTDILRHRTVVLLAAFASFAAIAAVIGYYLLANQLGPPPLEAAAKQSVTVVDRNGRLLRAFTTSAGRWRLPVTVDEVDPRYVKMLLAYEDRRFYDHGGIDPLAVLRAGWQLVRHGRLISGASTLTMQSARLLDGVHGRSVIGKLRQMIRARQLEARLTKTQILNLYLRLAPFGGNIEGLRAASLTYFGKEPRRLSIGQAALLVALPQSPAARRPDRHPGRARRARAHVLKSLVAAGSISRAEAKRANFEPIPRRRRPFAKLAPHLAEAELVRFPHQAIHRLTIERAAQSALERLTRDHARRVGSRLSAALLAIDHRTGEVIAHVGAADYFDKMRFGGIDMVKAIRSPGSTLKPFIYGLAFEAGLAHPETLIEDRAVRYGNYAPKNFDKLFHGTVTVREALATSLNIPAVKLLHAVGPSKLVSRFTHLGTLAPLPPGTEPSLALALGGIGMRMSDLAALYAALARGGVPVRIFHRRDDAKLSPAGAPRLSGAEDSSANSHQTYRRTGAKRLMSEVAAWYVTDILKDAPPPTAARAGRIAFKTGTSYGYRDAWAAGFDGHYTIVAWVGRPDGASTPGLTGRTAAAPLLFDAFARLSLRRAPLPQAPAGALRLRGTDLPPPLKRFGRGLHLAAQGPFLEPPPRLAFPPDRAELEFASNGGVPEPIILRAKGGVLPLTWLANGRPINRYDRRRQIAFSPEGPGFVNLSIIDAKGRVDRVTVRLR